MRLAVESRQEVPEAQIQQILTELNLAPIREKLTYSPPEGQGWNEKQATEAELWYRRFLVLMLVYPDHPHVPNGPIDAFWHTHILDTEKYAEDCQRIFGRFIHHFPYFGLRGDADVRDNAFEVTNSFYRELFEEDCTSMRTHELHNQGGSCGDKGGGTGCGQRCGKK